MKFILFSLTLLFSISGIAQPTNSPFRTDPFFFLGQPLKQFEKRLTCVDSHIDEQSNSDTSKCMVYRLNMFSTDSILLGKMRMKEVMLEQLKSGVIAGVFLSNSYVTNDSVQQKAVFESNEQYLISYLTERFGKKPKQEMVSSGEGNTRQVRYKWKSSKWEVSLDRTDIFNNGLYTHVGILMIVITDRTKSKELKHLFD